MKNKAYNTDLVNETNAALSGEAQELSDDELNEVTGAGNVFANLPRVPTQAIDENLRQNA